MKSGRPNKRKGVIAITSAILVLAAGLYLAARPRLYQGNTLEEWAIAADNGDTNAVAMIEVIGPASVSEFRKMLQKNDAASRRYVFGAQSRAPGWIRSLVWRVSKPTSAAPLRRAAANALGILGSRAAEAVPDLGGTLCDEADDVRWQAAMSLARMGEAGIAELVKALDSEDGRIRHSAVYGLGLSGTNGLKALPALITALQDADNSVRESSYSALCSIGAPAIIALNTAANSGEHSAREIAQSALRRLHDTSPTILDKTLGWARSGGQWEREAALKAITIMGWFNRNVMNVMTNNLSHSNAGVRAAAIRTIGEAGRVEPGVEKLLQQLALQDPDPAVRSMSSLVLSNWSRFK